MIQTTVGDFKARFSDLLDSVMQGDEVEILYGRAKKPVAQVSKIQEKQKRVIGTLDGIASFYEADGGKITMEEFLGMDEVEK
jgi:antitoxin (DNA-binding transcriptional repressor) of toxin-antitoxin stability system